MTSKNARFVVCILAAGAFSSVRTDNLVVNGDFETGDFSGGAYPAERRGILYWMAVNTSPNTGNYGAHHNRPANEVSPTGKSRYC